MREEPIKGNLSKDEKIALVALMNWLEAECGVHVTPGEAMRICLRFTSSAIADPDDPRCADVDISQRGLKTVAVVFEKVRREELRHAG